MSVAEDRVQTALEALRKLSRDTGSSPSVTPPDASRRWQLDFEYWLRSECRFRDLHWSPVVDLHSDFTSWCRVQRNVSAEAFRSLIESAGFYVEAVRGVVWCHGLVLRHYLLPDEAEKLRPSPLDEYGRLVISLWRGG